MDKNAIKKYAVWARRELIERVSQRALLYGVTAKIAGDPNADSVNGKVLSAAEKMQRQALIRNVKEKGYEQVMEEAAYTWFNRFAALRFMEVNGYLPSYVRVFTNEAGEFKPQILAEAIHLELDGLDMNKVYELVNANKSEDLFKYLLIVQCNALSSILPSMFQKIDDYTELLLPDYLLREGSVIEQMVTAIPEEDWTDQVQIIGWLYQYYNTEPKDKVFADLKKNIKITKENIPAATQLFTPDWIVHYMVENSLGRLWLEGHPNEKLKSEWKYYLDKAEQGPEVEAQLATIRKEYAALKPEEIRVIDPCMGSGHILCVLFDVLVRIYEDYGFTAREAAAKIVEKNLWGLDIDERAAQLAYFAVMMKARQYDRRFFIRNIQPHVYAIEESNGITSAPMHDMGLHLTQEEYGKAVKQALQLVEEMNDAKEYGSIIHVTPCDWELLRHFAVPRDENGQLHLDIHGEIEASARLQVLSNIGEALSQKYHAVVTNPPYMGYRGMSGKLATFVTKNYPVSKSDLFAVFIERCKSLTESNGLFALITQHSWMFISAYAELRKIVNKDTVINMIHLGARAFDEIAGEVVQTTAFVERNGNIKGYKGTYSRLITGLNEGEKESLFLSHANEYYATQSSFVLIPGNPIAYWVSPSVLQVYENSKLLGKIASPKTGMTTGDNNRFLRLWEEVDYTHISLHETSSESARLSKKKWFPYCKGGGFRRYYGYYDYLVNWENDGYEIKNNIKPNGLKAASVRSEGLYFKPLITWSAVSTGSFSCRFCDGGSLFDSGGSSIFVNRYPYYILGLMNSKVAQYFLDISNATINYQPGDVAGIPVLFDHIQMVEEKVHVCIELAKKDWDSYETSWDFQRHPLIQMIPKGGAFFERDNIDIAECYALWESECEEQFANLKAYEEELNSIFINIYGLQDELTPRVEDKYVTVRKAELAREVRSLVSYAVGCMFGRYSLNELGLVYAGGEWDALKYSTFKPDKDAIIPICDDEYFEDDIVGRFVKFVETVYGKTSLEENLSFIANALGGRGSSREVIRNYFINDFYSDHLKVYQKRPIYWLFDSGKKNGFKCLVYMHRYQPDTIARIRTDYVHEQQSRYRTAIADLEQRISGASTSERVKLSKRLAMLQAQAGELRLYEEKIHHLADQMIRIDLDDGVKHNYNIFKDVLATIK